jgi:triacylglycerol lipase
MLGVLAALLIAAMSSAVAQAHTPILFVHGWNGSASNWNTMKSRFEKDGWAKSELSAWTYNSTQSNAAIAKEVASHVESLRSTTHAAKVDLITHSMGGLSSRYYIKNLGGEATVEKWISLAGPNHGTTTADSCFEISCVEMRPNSTFLNELNAGSETPGPVVYHTWWSPCDEIINPQESTILKGATNTKTACISHLAFLSDETVYHQVREFVR